MIAPQQIFDLSTHPNYFYTQPCTHPNYFCTQPRTHPNYFYTQLQNHFLGGRAVTGGKLLRIPHLSH